MTDASATPTPANTPPSTDSAGEAPATTETTAPPVQEITPEVLRAADTPTGWWGRRYRAVEAFVSRLSYRNNFWHRICSLFFLRLAFKSGIKLGKQKGDYYETGV